MRAFCLVRIYKNTKSTVSKTEGVLDETYTDMNIFHSCFESLLLTYDIGSKTLWYTFFAHTSLHLYASNYGYFENLSKLTHSHCDFDLDS